MKIYSNKEFSQLSEFFTKRTSSTRRFQKFVRKFLQHVETENKTLNSNKSQAKEKEEWVEEELAILEGLRAKGTREL